MAENVTIGAGTITCNHDGVGINRTIIEEGAYIGSGCQLVAPLRVNRNATVASGSTITEDVAGEALTVARVRQVTVEAGRGLSLVKKQIHEPINVAVWGWVNMRKIVYCLY